jgi:Fic family protein
MFSRYIAILANFIKLVKSIKFYKVVHFSCLVLYIRYRHSFRPKEPLEAAPFCFERDLPLIIVKMTSFLVVFHDYVDKIVKTAILIIMPKQSATFNKINALRERYYGASNGKDALIKLINEAEVAEQVYNSNAIENSTLTLKETEKILLEIDLDRYINEREIFEAKNLARVVSYIDKKSKDQELTLDVILLLHKMLISNIRDDIAGRFREDGEYVRVGSHIAPAPNEVVERLEKMLSEYHAVSHENIIKRIARLHLTFEYTHPFIDGNGRIGRVLNNYLLMREGFVPINIKFIDRKKYYEAFNAFDKNGATNIMEEIVGKALTNSYHKRLAYLEGKKIVTLAEYAKRNKLSHSNLINKANRQTIEAFLEKDEWKIGEDGKKA